MIPSRPRPSAVLTLALLALAVAAMWDGDGQARVGSPGATDSMTYVVALFATTNAEPLLPFRAADEFRDSLVRWLGNPAPHVVFQPEQAYFIPKCQEGRYCEVIWLQESFDTRNMQTVSLVFRSPDSTFKGSIHAPFTRDYRYQVQWAPELWNNRRAAFSAFAQCMRIHHRDIHQHHGRNPSPC